MASKVWRFVKKITLCGVVVSSLPILFPILLFILSLGFAFAVPLGFMVVSYICLRKMFAVVIQKNLINVKGIFGLKSPESETTVKSNLEALSNEVVETGFNAENEGNVSVENPYESEGPSIEKLDQTIPHSKEKEKRPQFQQYFDRETLDGDNHHKQTHQGETSGVKYREAEPYEEISHEGQPHQGEIHEEISYEGMTNEEKAREKNTYQVDTVEETLALKSHEGSNELKEEDPHAMPKEKFTGLDPKHKRKEEKEESNEMKEIPLKRSCVDEHEEFASRPSIPGKEKKSGEAKIVTPKLAYCSAQQVAQAGSLSSTGRPSSLESNHDSIAGEFADEMPDITRMPRVEVHASSQPESGQDSKSSEQVKDDEENVWEEIDAVRKIVGYKGAPNSSYVDEIRALYAFMGVEPPTSLKNSFNLAEVKEKLEFLKSVVGVK